MSTGKLARYQSMRDFKKTEEPSGREEVLASERLRFVVQKHDATRLHYDLRLEYEGAFKSWAVTRGPSLNPKDRRLAVEVEDHPLAYGDFEGTIPKGEYGGGTVMLWDRGFWAPERGFEDVDKALQKGELKFVMEGERLHGGWVIVRLKDKEVKDPRKAGRNWLLIKHRDEAATEADGDEKEDRSVASRRTLDEIASGEGPPARPFMTGKKTAADAVWRTREAGAPKEAARAGAKTRTPAKAAAPPPAAGKKASPRARAATPPPPDFIEPQLARLVAGPPSGAGWVHEIKFDGYRTQLRVHGGDARLRTRKGLNWTHRFGSLGAAAARLPEGIYDGEIVALNAQGAPDFAALQTALSDRGGEGLTFFVFDLLYEGGEDVRSLPLTERKTRLARLLKDAPPGVRFVEHFEATGDAVLKSACRMDLEGVVSKRLDAPYASGRGEAWLKSKCRQGEEVVVGGYALTDGAFRSLLAGVHRDGALHYVGRIGSGYSRAVVDRLLPRLEAKARDRSPFSGPGAPKPSKDLKFIEPDLVAEIEYAGFTSDGRLRQASFKGLREDKPAGEVTGEAAKSPPAPGPSVGGARRVGGGEVFMGVTLTHPTKALWPDDGAGGAVLKRDLAEYFEKAAHLIMPHLEGRPCSLVRMPDGVLGQTFFQRHAGKGQSALFSEVSVKGDRKPYLEIDRPEALIAAAQAGATELHPWNCAPFKPDVPGRLVFDLDPAPDVPFAVVVEAAKEVKARLEALGLQTFCKTTGGKGLHVTTPVSAEEVSWAEAKAFAKEVCARMAADAPQRFLLSMAKKDRTGRIFLDYLRNDVFSTAVAPFSPRGRPGAPVSTPISWREVGPGLDPKSFTVKSLLPKLSRLKGWRGYEEGRRPLRPAIEALARRGS